MDDQKERNQGLQKPTTQLSTKQSAIACTAQHEWSNLATEKEIDAALSEIQWAKGKFYSQVIERMTEKMPKAEFEKRTMEHRTGLITAIKRLKVSTEELEVMTRRAKQAEFTGTTFMPLPTESDMIKIAKEVQGEMLQKRSGECSYQPPMVDMTLIEGKTADQVWDMVLEKFGVAKQERKSKRAQQGWVLR